MNRGKTEGRGRKAVWLSDREKEKKRFSSVLSLSGSQRQLF